MTVQRRHDTSTPILPGPFQRLRRGDGHGNTPRPFGPLTTEKLDAARRLARRALAKQVRDSYSAHEKKPCWPEVHEGRTQIAYQQWMLAQPTPVEIRNKTALLNELLARQTPPSNERGPSCSGTPGVHPPQEPTVPPNRMTADDVMHEFNRGLLLRFPTFITQPNRRKLSATFVRHGLATKPLRAHGIALLYKVNAAKFWSCRDLNSGGPRQAQIPADDPYWVGKGGWTRWVYAHDMKEFLQKIRDGDQSEVLMDPTEIEPEDIVGVAFLGTSRGRHQRDLERDVDVETEIRFFCADPASLPRFSYNPQDGTLHKLPALKLKGR